MSNAMRTLCAVSKECLLCKRSGPRPFVGISSPSLADVFQPLFEVTKDPKTHPELHVFLQRVIGFDSVDDESKAERRTYKKYPFPKAWDKEQNPVSASMFQS